MVAVHPAKQQDVTDVAVFRNTASIDLWYPNSRNVKYIEVGLIDVRAADNIRVSYDFDRDGWKVEQASRFAWNVGDEECDADWQEVAFVGAWARKETEEQEEARLNVDLPPA